MILGYQPPLTKAYILERVSQEQIMSHFLDVDIMTIREGVSMNRLICSPLRIDRNPTCGFYIDRKSVLRFNDFGGYFHGDCFDVVGYRMLLNPYNNADFMKILDKIAREFNLWYYQYDNTIKNVFSPNELQLQPKGTTVISVHRREWQQQDVSYFRKYRISIEQATKAHIHPIYAASINGRLIYSFSNSDVCYGYYHGILNAIEQWKLYFPFRKDKRPRFLTNTTRMQNMGNVQVAPFGIITKALKDALSLESFDIPAVAVAAESIAPSESEMQYLKSKWEKIYSLFDFDLTGIRLANKLKRQYQIEPLFLTNGKFGTTNYQSKDFSDLIANNTDSFVTELVETLRYDGLYSQSHYKLINKWFK